MSPRVPALIFANWREMLNQLKLARAVRHTYAQAIEGYLDYCRLNGVSVALESARGFVADALRRGLTQDGPGWKSALNWFFREGRKRSAAQPEGVPSLGHADTGRTAWESRLIERLRLKHYSWRTEQTYREWAWRLSENPVPNVLSDITKPLATSRCGLPSPSPGVFIVNPTPAQDPCESP